MSTRYLHKNPEADIPIFGDLDARLRLDTDGVYLAQLLDLLHGARSELKGPARSDAAYRCESNLMDGALSAADQVLRSIWAGSHPQPAARGHITSL